MSIFQRLGSTIMLLTVPWFLSVLGGRVKIDPKTGLPNYKNPKLPSHGYFHFTQTGVSISQATNNGGLLMLVTCISYIIIQFSNFLYGTKYLAEGEHPWAGTGCIVCFLFFCGYLYYQYVISESDEVTNKRLEKTRKLIQDKKITLTGVLISEMNLANNKNDSPSNLEGK